MLSIAASRKKRLASDLGLGMSMQIFYESTLAAVSRRAAELIVEQLQRKPDLILCGAAGETPTKTYQLLAEKRLVRPELFERLRVVKLDEWVGLNPNSPATCEFHLRKHLLDPLDITDDRYLGFRSDCVDPQADSARVAAALIQSGPIDLCLLGLGVNGHIGLNEPADFISPRAHVVTLHNSTRNHSMLRQSLQEVRLGMTLGMAEIMSSQRILLIVSGERKQQAMRQLLEERIDADFPASLLWLHPNVTCLCDREAAPAIANDPHALPGQPHFVRSAHLVSPGPTGCSTEKSVAGVQ